MGYLLDTNVVSEPIKPAPNPNVIRWLQEISPELQYLSILSIGELRRGLEMLPAGRRREKLQLLVEHDLPGWYGARLLPVTIAIAERWGRLAAQARWSLPRFDALIAATALHHDLRLVTRNVSDFQFPGLQVINPWEFE
jgi:predicted nucleic acid-binding protein